MERSDFVELLDLAAAAGGEPEPRQLAEVATPFAGRGEAGTAATPADECEQATRISRLDLARQTDGFHRATAALIAGTAAAASRAAARELAAADWSGRTESGPWDRRRAARLAAAIADPDFDADAEPPHDAAIVVSRFALAMDARTWRALRSFGPGAPFELGRWGDVTLDHFPVVVAGGLGLGDDAIPFGDAYLLHRDDGPPRKGEDDRSTLRRHDVVPPGLRCVEGRDAVDLRFRWAGRFAVNVAAGILWRDPFRLGGARIAVAARGA